MVYSGVFHAYMKSMYKLIFLSVLYLLGLIGIQCFSGFLVPLLLFLVVALFIVKSRILKFLIVELPFSLQFCRFKQVLKKCRKSKSAYFSYLYLFINKIQTAVVQILIVHSWFLALLVFIFCFCSCNFLIPLQNIILV